MLKTITALSLGFTLFAPSSGGQTITTRHFEDVVPLRPDAAHLAVLPLPGGTDPGELLAARGLTASVERRLPVGGAMLLRVPVGVSAHAFGRSLLAGGDELFVAPVFLDDLGGPMLPTPALILRFEPGTPVDQQRSLLDALVAGEGASLLEGPRWAGLSDAYKLGLPTRDGDAVIGLANLVNDRADVQFAQPNWIFSGRSTSLIPDDPLFGDTWGLDNVGQSGGVADEDMDAVEAWDLTLGDPDIITVVLDVGVEQTHPDIAQVPGEDFVYEGSGGDAFNACDHHGTAVAGCISGSANNGLGTAGVAPGTLIASARAYATDVGSCNGSWFTYFESTPNALAWAESIGARVTNNSNVFGFTDVATELKYAQTRDDGMVHFASAGNFSVAFVEYPASLPSIVAVAASDRFGNRAGFSSWGPGLGITAPGASIMTTDRTGPSGYHGGDYGFVDGTSFASPYTAGVAALVLSLKPALGAAEVEDILFGTAVDKGASGYDTDFGWGVVNAFAAVSEVNAWTDEGCALAGSFGFPQLTGEGSLAEGTFNQLTLTNVPGSALAIYFTSLSSTPVPFKGGTLKPFPLLIEPFLVTVPPDGILPLPFIMPGGIPEGVELWAQWGIADPGAVVGVSLSNAIKGLTP